MSEGRREYLRRYREAHREDHRAYMRLYQQERRDQGGRMGKAKAIFVRCEVNRACRTNQAIWWTWFPNVEMEERFEIISAPRPEGALACCAACKAALRMESRRVGEWGGVGR